MEKQLNKIESLIRFYGTITIIFGLIMTTEPNWITTPLVIVLAIFAIFHGIKGLN